VDAAAGDGSGLGVTLATGLGVCVDAGAVAAGVSAKGVTVPVGGALCRVGSLTGERLGGGVDGVELGKATVDVPLCEGRIGLGS
jgi:hypothetical protein